MKKIGLSDFSATFFALYEVTEDNFGKYPVLFFAINLAFPFIYGSISESDQTIFWRIGFDKCNI